LASPTSSVLCASVANPPKVPKLMPYPFHQRRFDFNIQRGAADVGFEVGLRGLRFEERALEGGRVTVRSSDRRR